VRSRFEIVNNKFGKDFILFDKYSRYTYDSIMTLAIVKAFLICKGRIYLPFYVIIIIQIYSLNGGK